MKIYFEDGELRHEVSELTPFLCSNSCYIIDAGQGVSSCINDAEYFLSSMNPDIKIYTNCLELFKNRYAWNKELGVPEVYIRHKDTREFIRIDEATPRLLREGHNLAHLYLAGEFDSVTLR